MFRSKMYILAELDCSAFLVFENGQMKKILTRTKMRTGMAGKKEHKLI